MRRARTVVGAAVLCALALGALGAASASAEGLTAVTCKEAEGGPGTGTFETDHCTTPSVEKGDYETAQVPEGTAITGEDSNDEGGHRISILHVTVFGAKVDVICSEAHITGIVTNIFDESSGEHRAHGTEGVIHYTGCHAKLAANSTQVERCKVENLIENTNKGTITTNKLTTTTGKEHKVTIKPATGTTFTDFTILAEATEAGFQCKLPKTKVTVTGELIAIANTTTHSHLTLEEATNGSNFKANGATASYNGTYVFYMEEEGETPGNTVGLTTF